MCSALEILIMTAVLAGAESTPFSIGIELPAQVPVTPAVENALRAMGIDYFNYYIKPSQYCDDEKAMAINRELIALADRLDVDFSIACYTVDPPEAVVREAKGHPRFQGIVFDELEHARLLNAHTPTPLADTEQLESLEQAYAETLDGFRALHDRYAALDTPVVSTHIWPVLHHVAARAGFIPCPKICKELYSSVSLAIGMGAALQYDRPLWVDVDMWFWDLVPGHPPEEVESNLLLAYWLGADRVYIEGAGHNLTTQGEQGIPFSLMTQVTPERYQLTAHGEMLRRFIREYLPANPRPWTFRDVKPDIAIVRFPDSDHGQHYTHLGQPAWDDTQLYGSPHLLSTPDTRAWFQIWNLITFGATGLDGLTYFKHTSARAGFEGGGDPQRVVQSLHSRPFQADHHRFFVPLNGAVVFDHLVAYEHLKDIPLIFVTGVALSDDTRDAIERCAEEGATVVFWGPLAKQHGFADYEGGFEIHDRGEGRIILTDDFNSRRVFAQVHHLIGLPNAIRYRFGDEVVRLERVTDNEVRVVRSRVEP